MRATDGLQTTITLGSVKDNGQAFSLELSLEMSLPMPRQDEHLPDQIEAYVHQAGLEVTSASNARAAIPKRASRNLSMAFRLVSRATFRAHSALSSSSNSSSNGDSIMALRPPKSWNNFGS